MKVSQNPVGSMTRISPMSSPERRSRREMLPVRRISAERATNIKVRSATVTIHPPLAVPGMQADLEYVRHPEIDGLCWFKPVTGFGRCLLFTDDKRPDHSVIKIADDTIPAFSSAQFLMLTTHAYKETSLKDNGARLAAEEIITKEIGGVTIVKYGELLVGFTDHFFVRFRQESGRWILEAVSNGRDADELYSVTHPPGMYVCVSMTLAGKIVVDKVECVAEDQEKIDRYIDLFGPRSVVGPTNTIIRMYFNRGGQELFALTRGDRLFRYAEIAEGFQFVVGASGDAELREWDDIFTIGRGIMMERVPDEEFE